MTSRMDEIRAAAAAGADASFSRAVATHTRAFGTYSLEELTARSTQLSNLVQVAETELLACVRSQRHTQARAALERSCTLHAEWTALKAVLAEQALSV